MADDLRSLVKDGFNLPHKGGLRQNIRDLALLSLRTALKAFSSTYQCMKYSIRTFDPASSSPDTGVDAYLHRTEYSEAAAETIIHFQHFAELVCKDILRQEHELLANDVSFNHHVIFYKLLTGKSISENEQEKTKSIEFSLTLKRIQALLDTKHLDIHKYGFLKEYNVFLEELNGLRNRIWHRGRFILRYPALDKLISRHALPFMKAVLALPNYKGTEDIWKHSPLACRIAPLNRLIEPPSAPYNPYKIAFFKELIRAAYVNNIRGTGAGKTGRGKSLLDHYDRKATRRALAVADSEIQSEHAEARDCIVCGLKSLMIYSDVEPEGFDPSDGTYQRVWHYTYEVYCTQCTFSISNSLENPRAYGLKVRNFWTIA